MSVKDKIKEVANIYASNLRDKIAEREIDMQSDDNSHYLIYRILGISNLEGRKIDLYQNTGRFLYKYAGSFLEEVATICLQEKYPDGKKVKIGNTLGVKPKTFEIDFLNESDAIEIKWRDATTNGDHITKEHTRVKVITAKGLKPIRVMFYYPQREQAIKIQETLKTLYSGVSGDYYAGDDAWNFILSYTGFDLKGILEEIAQENE
ncbi:MAG: ApaLI family restriction endonuclease [Rikenellaceae bacterium]